MKISIIVMISVLLFFGSSVNSKDLTTVEKPKTSTKTSKKSKLSCKKRRSVGSHFRSAGNCRSAKEKARDKNDARTVMEQNQNHRTRAITPVGN